MEEKLIEVKKYKLLYSKGSIDYKNKRKRAVAWNTISKSLNIPESVCQSRWKSLRDRYVKEFNESHLASGSACEMSESQWIYYPNMEFLREQVIPRKSISSIPSHTPTESNFSFDVLEASDDSFIDYSDCAIPLSTTVTNDTSCSETASTSHRNRKRAAKTDELGEF